MSLADEAGDVSPQFLRKSCRAVRRTLRNVKQVNDLTYRGGSYRRRTKQPPRLLKSKPNPGPDKGLHRMKFSQTNQGRRPCTFVRACCDGYATHPRKVVVKACEQM